MLTARVIACLDIRDGRVVKGVRFGSLCDSGDPAALAAAYEQQGADELTLLDVSASAEGRLAALATIRAVRERIALPLTVGGGVRGIDDAARLLDAGADKVSINTAAVEQPGLINQMAARFGSQCTVVAIDAAANDGTYAVRTRSGSLRVPREAAEWAAECASRGAGEILLTSIDRDGTRSGYDLDLIRAVRGTPGIKIDLPIIASGGAGSPDDVVPAIRAGADAVLVAGILHWGQVTIGQIKSALAGAPGGGIAVRTEVAC